MNPKIHYLLTQCDGAQLLGMEGADSAATHKKWIRIEKSSKTEMIYGTE